MASPTITVSWRISPELYEALRREAGNREISLTALAIEKLSK